MDAGQLPALEKGLDIIEGTGDGFASGQAILQYLKSHGVDLDAHLTPTQVSYMRRAGPPHPVQAGQILAWRAFSGSGPYASVCIGRKQCFWLLPHWWRRNCSQPRYTRLGAK